jgi:hypothetical protein
MLLMSYATATAAAATVQTFESQQVASDCLWSDPAKEDQEVNFNRLNLLLQVEHVKRCLQFRNCTANYACEISR